MQRGSAGEAQDRTEERDPSKEERRFCPIICWWLGREGPGFTYMALSHPMLCVQGTPRHLGWQEAGWALRSSSLKLAQDQPPGQGPPVSELSLSPLWHLRLDAGGNSLLPPHWLTPVAQCSRDSGQCPVALLEAGNCSI